MLRHHDSHFIKVKTTTNQTLLSFYLHIETKSLIKQCYE